MLEIFQIAATSDFHRDRQLVSVKGLRVLSRIWSGIGIPNIFLCVIRIDVDQFYDEIAVGARRRCEQRGRQRSGDGKVVLEWRANVTQDVRAVVHKSLVGSFPSSPIAGWIGRRDWPLSIRDRIRGIRNVFAKLL